MDDRTVKFNAFLNKLESVSGKSTLINAIRKGFKTVTEAGDWDAHMINEYERSIGSDSECTHLDAEASKEIQRAFDRINTRLGKTLLTDFGVEISDCSCDSGSYHYHENGVAEATINFDPAVATELYGSQSDDLAANVIAELERNFDFDVEESDDSSVTITFDVSYENDRED